MIVVMKREAGDNEVGAVISRIEEGGLKPHLSRGVERTIIGVLGEVATKPVLREALERMPGVAEVVVISKPYKLSGREFQ